VPSRSFGGCWGIEQAGQKGATMVRYITIAFAFTVLGAALGYLASHAELDAAYKAKRANFDLQNKCALQAEKAVRQSKHENDDVAKKIGISNLVPGVLWSNYQSHYSPMLNKCFVVQEDHRENFGISKYLYDAYEQRIYATYSWTPVADKSSGACVLSVDPNISRNKLL
jgi:hypothetical protein